MRPNDPFARVNCQLGWRGLDGSVIHISRLGLKWCKPRSCIDPNAAKSSPIGMPVSFLPSVLPSFEWRVLNRTISAFALSAISGSSIRDGSWISNLGICHEVSSVSMMMRSPSGFSFMASSILSSNGQACLSHEWVPCSTVVSSCRERACTIRAPLVSAVVNVLRLPVQQ